MSWSTAKISVSFLVFCLFLPTSAWAKYQTLQPGLEYQEINLENAQTTLHLLRVNLKNFDIKPIDGRALGAPSWTVKEMAKKEGAVAVINANFFDPAKKPLGLVLRDGKILNTFHGTSWWASFLIKENHARITKVFENSQVKGYQQGIQAGPRLIIGGRTPKLKKEASPKSAVGIDKQGRIVFAATLGRVEISDLAKILSAPSNQGGLELTQALNLDGGSSTQFYLNANQREVYLPGLSKIPVGLGVFPKS